MSQNVQLEDLKRPQFIQLYQNLTELYQENSQLVQEKSYRSIEQAKSMIFALDFIESHLLAMLSENSYLESLLKLEFIDFKYLQNADWISQVVLLEFDPFKEKKFLIEDEFNFSKQKVDQLISSFQNWCEEKILKHESCQLFLEKLDDDRLSPQELECQCDSCISLYRTRLREITFNNMVKLVDEAVEILHEKVLFEKINNISSKVRSLKDQLQSRIKKVRFRLRRSTVNKLDLEIKSYFKRQFSPQSELGKAYREKIIAFLNLVCEEDGLKNEILGEQDYKRFIDNLELDLWKPAGFIRSEFTRFLSTLMSFKRKDISSTILKNYLGQFWLHSPARKKNRKVIYHMGPTNSGKTYHAIEALCQAQKGCYLAPLRLLAGELFDTMSEKGVVTTLLTGEEVIEKPGATHYSSTIEMAKLHEEFDCAVIDEIQMIGDPQRGWAWTRALVNLDADEVHLCGDASAHGLVEEILKLTGDTLEVRHYERMTQLVVEDRKIEMQQLKRGDALIVFSRRNALKFKLALEKLNFKVSIIYGMLSPEVRREQARKFDSGETDIMVSTDAIAMGMNLPVQRIVFSTFAKFYDGKEYPLSESEIKQIAGRAGRYLRFPTGYVTCLADDRGQNDLAVLHQGLNCTLGQRSMAMVGPDLEIFKSVNSALEENQLRTLDLTEFLRLFNTMPFQKPFYCVQLKEMIEITEMVEAANSSERSLEPSEVFGFACAPVNLGLIEHVEYFMRVVTRYVHAQPIYFEPIDTASHQIDYLETSIKCVELYQWLARHFNNKHFEFDRQELEANKIQAIERLNSLLSEKTVKYQFKNNPLMGFRRRRPTHHSRRQGAAGAQGSLNGKKKKKRFSAKSRSFSKSYRGQKRASK